MVADEPGLKVNVATTPVADAAEVLNVVLRAVIWLAALAPIGTKFVATKEIAATQAITRFSDV
jgi:hypothetical protein